MVEFSTMVILVSMYLTIFSHVRESDSYADNLKDKHQNMKPHLITCMHYSSQTTIEYYEIT